MAFFSAKVWESRGLVVYLQPTIRTGALTRLGNQCASQFCNLPAMPTDVCSNFVDVNIAVGDGVDGEG